MSTESNIKLSIRKKPAGFTDNEASFEISVIQRFEIQPGEAAWVCSAVPVIGLE